MKILGHPTMRNRGLWWGLRLNSRLRKDCWNEGMELGYRKINYVISIKLYYHRNFSAAYFMSICFPQVRRCNHLICEKYSEWKGRGCVTPDNRTCGMGSNINERVCLRPCGEIPEKCLCTNATCDLGSCGMITLKCKIWWCMVWLLYVQLVLS